MSGDQGIDKQINKLAGQSESQPAKQEGVVGLLLGGSRANARRGRRPDTDG